MEKAKQNKMLGKVLNLLVDAAPVTDAYTRCATYFGEPEYPNEKDYI